jgi:hypothetical protein
MDRVIFRFKHPEGSRQNPPSAAMHEALMCLAQADELQPLIREANKVGKFVSIEVFASKRGIPLLIHFTKESA